MAAKTSLALAHRIEAQIFLIRGHRVMLDADLATLYKVELKALNQTSNETVSVSPGDFMIRLTTEEATRLRSQTVILKTGRGRHRKYSPYVFTEQGVAMLSSVLRSRRAITPSGVTAREMICRTA